MVVLVLISLDNPPKTVYPDNKTHFGGPRNLPEWTDLPEWTGQNKCLNLLFATHMVLSKSLKSISWAAPSLQSLRPLHGHLASRHGGTFLSSRGTFPILSRDPSFQETIKTQGKQLAFEKIKEKGNRLHLSASVIWFNSPHIQTEKGLPEFHRVARGL